MSTLLVLTAEDRDQHLRVTFYRSMTAVVSAAALLLAFSERSFFPSGLTPFVALFSLYAVDHRRWYSLPTIGANLTGLLALAIAASEFSGNNLQKLLAGTHLLVYLTWIVLQMRKTNRQYWWLIALSVLQITISGVLSAGLGFGASVIVMALLLLWTLSVFSLYRVEDQHAMRLRKTASSATQKTSPQFNLTREFMGSFLGVDLAKRERLARQRVELASGIRARNGLQRDPSEVWIGWRFRGMVLGSYMVSLVLAGIVFAAFPRIWVTGGNLFSDRGGDDGPGFGRRTGFSESVRLGDVGRLMASNTRVLTFAVTNLRTGKDVTADSFANAMLMDEVRFRGNVLAQYSDGRWSPGLVEQLRVQERESPLFGNIARLDSDFRVQITLDPPIGTYAFAPYPVAAVRAPRGYRIDQRVLGNTLLWKDLRRDAETGEPRTYSVECPDLSKRTDATFEHWLIQDLLPDWVVEQQRASLMQRATRNYITESLSIRLPLTYSTARQICFVNGVSVTAQERVDRILRYLSPDNGFRYSLDLRRSNLQADPIEDFLFETRTGHCEYFASACALLLQSAGVPARMVTGYYGSEPNSLTGLNEVRQHHAHAWVEAWVDDRWITLDPTPAAEREEAVKTVASRSLLSNFQAAINDLWTDSVHKMSAERQRQFFAPVLTTWQDLLKSIREQGVLTVVRSWFSNLMHSPKDWFSWQGGVVAALLSGFIALCIRLGLYRRLLKLVQAIRARFSRQERATRSVIRFYEQFCQLCERHGLRLSPSSTAIENAAASAARFEVQLIRAGLTDLPERIAKAFNVVRFGSAVLTPEDASQLGRDLNTFAATLRGAATKQA